MRGCRGRARGRPRSSAISADKGHDEAAFVDGVRELGVTPHVTSNVHSTRARSAIAQPRLSALLLSGFGIVALLLAALGLNGVIASAVREQRRDMGIRLALGATPGHLRRQVIGNALGVISL